MPIPYPRSSDREKKIIKVFNSGYLYIGNVDLAEVCEELMEAYMKYPKLPNLYIENCCFEKDGGKAPYGIGAFSKLQMLTIKNCGLTEVPPSLIYLNELQSLDLRNNKLKYLPSLLDVCTNLKHIYLSGNPIENIEEIKKRLPKGTTVFFDEE